MPAKENVLKKPAIDPQIDKIEPQIDKIEPQIEIARTLPAQYYRDAKYFDLAREKVFARSWQFLTDSDKLNSAGQAFPITLLEEYLNEPLVLTRDTDDVIHCLSNVCTHRGNILVEAECQTQQLRCRYHGRRFSMNGQFANTPGFEEAKCFPTDQDNLPHVPFGQFSKFLFASAAPEDSLQEIIGDMEQRLSWLPLDQFFFDPSLSRDYDVKANWALYVDNYLEGFHVPYVHPYLATLLDPRLYRTELHKFSNVQIGVAQRPEDAFDLPPESPDYGQQIAAYYYWLFPNTMFNFYPWGLSINVVIPVKPDQTRVRFMTYVWDRSKLVVDALDRTEIEDEEIVAQVQKGVASRFYSQGRYSPRWETGVHHFHQLLLSALDEGEA